MAVSGLSRSFSSLKPQQQLAFLVTGMIAMIVLPLSIWAAKNQINYFPRAAGDITQESSASTRPPTFEGNFLQNTISCQVGSPCAATFSGRSASELDPLALTIDFLPSPLKQNTCEQTALPGSRTITCSFSGTPSRPGEFKLLLTLSNNTGTSTQKVVTLSIR